PIDPRPGRAGVEEPGGRRASLVCVVADVVLERLDTRAVRPVFAGLEELELGACGAGGERFSECFEPGALDGGGRACADSEGAPESCGRTDDPEHARDLVEAREIDSGI